MDEMAATAHRAVARVPDGASPAVIAPVAAADRALAGADTGCGGASAPEPCTGTARRPVHRITHRGVGARTASLGIGAAQSLAPAPALAPALDC
ncbi:hypothetical protein [Streptomyces sp. NPDC017435]|uniref:hypothetical protein n=1 Tax=Streptomyces sp. NPDC017435 TaxID=3364995 RepID=UPI0037A79A16